MVVAFSKTSQVSQFNQLTEFNAIAKKSLLSFIDMNEWSYQRMNLGVAGSDTANQHIFNKKPRIC